jgi:hypothetical protein
MAMRESDQLTDLDLLMVQAERSLDQRGYVVDLSGIEIAVAKNGQALWLGAGLADDLAIQLASTYERAPPTSNPSTPPPALVAFERVLNAVWGQVHLQAGPYYLIEADLSFSSDAEIQRSDATSGHSLRDSNPGNWHPVEWEELIEGRLGPWAMATEGNRVISICHTPRPLTPHSAECGVWTDPEFRGRGHAAAVTAAWANILRPSGRYLFYSTDAQNVSSQRVAQRLDLRPIGWIWRLERAEDRRAPLFHPLSSLRPSRTTPTDW